MSHFITLKDYRSLRPKVTHLEFFSKLEELSNKASQLVTKNALERVRKKGWFSIALSGGKTPARMYDFLGQEVNFPWSHTHVFWGDERFMPFDSVNSNYKLASDHLLTKVNIPSSNIHPMKIDSASLAKAAIDSENNLIQTFRNIISAKTGKNSNNEAIPKFDLILLGIGSDGHTASIFPKSPIIFESKRLIRAVDRAFTPPYVPRLTFTLPLINQARTVIFLVSGREKHSILLKVLTSAKGPCIPASLICPVEELYWFIEPDFDSYELKLT